MSRILAFALLPLIFWQQDIATAPALKRAGIERIAVTPDVAGVWRNAGFEVVAISPADLARRTSLDAPRIIARADLASPTRAPWVVANGWRFVRQPGASFAYNNLPSGRAPLAAAEAFVYQADVVLKIDAADLNDTGALLTFLKSIPAVEMNPVADIGVVDDGSTLVGEVLNLLTRRNLLFRIVPASSPNYRINVKPVPEMADPSEFALKIRRQLTDEQRSLRVYGSEIVICRLTANSAGARLHLLNYGGRDMEGLRVRLKGAYKTATASSLGLGKLDLEDMVVEPNAIEFTFPRMGLYSVVDLTRK